MSGKSLESEGIPVGPDRRGPRAEKLMDLDEAGVQYELAIILDLIECPDGQADALHQTGIPCFQFLVEEVHHAEPLFLGRIARELPGREDDLDGAPIRIDSYECAKVSRPPPFPGGIIVERPVDPSDRIPQ